MDAPAATYLHNTLHQQARWAYENDLTNVLANREYEYWVADYVNVAPSERVSVGYVLD